MSRLNDLPLRRLQFYVTTQYPCGYLPEQQARSLTAIPANLIDTVAYSELVRMGFRRSGSYTYRPHCDQCQACVPVRIKVDDFVPNRSQKRAQKQHANLEVYMLPLVFSAEHFQLYSQYQKRRHGGGGMDNDDSEQYRSFLMQSQVDTVLVEFREDGVLRMVGVMDRLTDGLSAVYAFYDAEMEKASYGTYNVLWLIECCRQLGLPHLYLGYWIAQARKMSYKKEFQPMQGFINDIWQPLPA